MTAPLESSIVRFRKFNGAIVGAGFLISEKHVLTCAHVVADALGIARDTQDIPIEDVYLDFPLVDSEKQLTAKVVFWSPVPLKGSTSVKGKEDIAGLELKSTLPEGVQPVGLVIKEDLRGHPFRTFGFPAGHDDGLEATGVLRGRQGTGWVQLEGVKQTGVRLEPGFSGAPVWDEKLKGVVGMAVAADQKRPEAKVAFMIPTEVLATVWSDLGKLIIQPKPFPLEHKTFWRWTGLALIPALGILVITVLQSLKLLPIARPQLTSCINSASTQNSKKTVIAIANFIRNDGSNDQTLEIELLSKLPTKLQSDSDVEVCRLEQVVVDDKGDAKRISQNLKAIVVWAYKDSNSFRGGIEGWKIELPGQAWTSDVEIEGSTNLVALLTNLTISQIYYLNEDIEKARTTLDMALRQASSQTSFAKANAEELAQAYFFLGQLFQPNSPECEQSAECEAALRAYDLALYYNPNMYQALFSKGVLYTWSNDYQAAIAAYTQLINSKSPQAQDALLNRGFLYVEILDRKAAEADFEDLIKADQVTGYWARGSAHLQIWNEPEKAIDDLQKLLTLQKNAENYNLLGLSQLQAGQVLEAQQTYIVVRCYLVDDDTRNELLNSLIHLSKQNPEKPQLLKAISSIIKMLKAAPAYSSPKKCN